MTCVCERVRCGHSSCRCVSKVSVTYSLKVLIGLGSPWAVKTLVAAEVSASHTDKALQRRRVTQADLRHKIPMQLPTQCLASSPLVRRCGADRLLCPGQMPSAYICGALMAPPLRFSSHWDPSPATGPVAGQQQRDTASSAATVSLQRPPSLIRQSADIPEPPAEGVRLLHHSVPSVRPTTLRMAIRCSFEAVVVHAALSPVITSRHGRMTGLPFWLASRSVPKKPKWSCGGYDSADRPRWNQPLLYERVHSRVPRLARHSAGCVEECPEGHGHGTDHCWHRSSFISPYA